MGQSDRLKPLWAVGAVGSRCIGAPVPSKTRTGWNWFTSLLYGRRLPLGQRGATKKMNCTADLLLIFCMERDCLWDSKEQHLGNEMECILSVLLLPVPEAVLFLVMSLLRVIFVTADYCILTLIFQYRRLSNSASEIFDQLQFYLVPYKNVEQISCAVHSKYCSSLSQMKSCPIQDSVKSMI